jgi:hypothetical protein
MAQGSESPTAGRCGAKLRRSNPARYCLQWPIRGRTRCKLHGGKSPIGPAAAAWKTGVHSKWLRANRKGSTILAAYEATIRDPELRTVREQIAVATGLEADALARIGTGASLEAWQQAGGLYRAVNAALRTQNTEAMASALRELGQVLETGSHSARAWIEALRALRENIRARAAEGRLRMLEHRQVSLDELMVLARGIAELALRYIVKPKDRREFSHEIRALLASNRPTAIVEDVG